MEDEKINELPSFFRPNMTLPNPFPRAAVSKIADSYVRTLADKYESSSHPQAKAIKLLLVETAYLHEVCSIQVFEKSFLPAVSRAIQLCSGLDSKSEGYAVLKTAILYTKDATVNFFDETVREKNPAVYLDAQDLLKTLVTKVNEFEQTQRLALDK